MANASLEDCQLFAQSEILQRDLFIAAKEQEDHPKKREDCVQHEAESVSASSLKINCFRNRWNSGEAHPKCSTPVSNTRPSTPSPRVGFLSAGAILPIPASRLSSSRNGASPPEAPSKT